MSGSDDGRTWIRRDRVGAACAVLALGIALATWTAGCGKSPAAPADYKAENRFEIMSTDGQITVYVHGTEAEATREADEALRSAMTRLQEIEKKLNIYDGSSELSRLNAAAGGDWMDISATTGEAIEASRRAWQASGGAFNPLVGSLVRLWREAETRNRLPTEDEIGKALTLLDMQEVLVEPLKEGGYRARLTQAGMRLDLGGLAKGWASQETVDVLRGHAGMRAALVNLGGDGAAWSGPGWTRPWTFGVQDPLTPDGRTQFKRLTIGSGAVVTSGSYYRWYDIGGRHWSHVLDPRTGWPVENAVVSATVVCDDGGQADALATACMVLGPEKAVALLEGLNGTEGMVIEREASGELKAYRTAGFRQYETGD